VSYKKKELFILQDLLGSSRGLGGIRVVAYISNTASVLSAGGTVYPSGTTGFIPGFW
jgi:hypothetical protein